MSLAKKYRVAVIGHTGRGDYGHGIDTVWLEVDRAELVGVADPNEVGLAAAVKRLKLDPAKGYADYRKLLDETKPEVISICPRWIDQHRDLIMAAVERGIHIYMEKPFCRTPAEADEIVDACERRHVKLAIAHQTHYSPKIETIKKLIAGGAIGDVMELRGRGKEDATRGGGEDLWVLGSHILDLMRLFAGDAKWCFATLTEKNRPVTKANVKPGNEGLGPLAGDLVQAMYGFGGGITGYFGSRRGAAGDRFALQIYGSRGIIELTTGFLPSAKLLADPKWSPGRSNAKWQNITTAGVDQPEPLNPQGGPLHAGNLAAVNDLLDSIEGHRPPKCGAYQGRAIVEMICGVFDSHRNRGPVELPLKNRQHALAMLR